MTNSRNHKTTIILLLLLLSKLSQAQPGQSLQLVTNASLTVNSFANSGALNDQYEARFFLDATHLQHSGFGIGYIYQNQGQSNNDDIVNNLMHYNAWHSWFPETLPGKVSFIFNYYRGSETTHVSNSNSGSGNNGGSPGPGPGSGKPSPTSINFTDSLEILNPVLSFINYRKTFYMDMAYATSKYKTSNTTVGNLDVDQWSPALGFAFNNKYDWLQFRYYHIDLSNAIRTPNIDNTGAHSVSWTHWVEKEAGRTLDNFTLSLLTGERLYAVDHDIRKIYNLTDMQTSSYIFSTHWKNTETSDFYVAAGYEEYKDVSANDTYNSWFIHTGITTRW